MLKDKLNNLFTATQLHFNRLKVFYRENNFNKLSVIAVLTLFMAAGVVLSKNTTNIFSKAIGETVSVYFNPASVALTQSTSFSMLMDAKSNRVLFTRAVLIFDPAKVRLMGVTPGTGLNRVVQLPDITNANNTGRAVFVLALPPASTPPTGVFEIARFSLSPISIIPNDTSMLTYLGSDMEVTEKSEIDLPISVSPAQVVMNPVTPTLTPVPTTPPIFSPTPVPPGTPLVISNVQATDISETTATIRWTLSDYGTGQVEYGKTTAYGLLSTKETSLDWNYHIQVLSNLTPGTFYHYRVISANQAGQTTTSGDNIFQTLGSVTSTPLPTFVPTSIPTAIPTYLPTSTPPVPSPTPPPANQTLIFNPTDDAVIYARYPNTNAGRGGTIRIDNNPVEHTLIKFAVSGINGRKVLSAKLRLYNTQGSAFGGYFYSTSGSWSQSGVTWNNAPQLSQMIASLGKVRSGNWYEADLSSYITGDGTYSLRITSKTSDGADYSSREGNHPPELVISL